MASRVRRVARGAAAGLAALGALASSACGSRVPLPAEATQAAPTPTPTPSASATPSAEPSPTVTPATRPPTTRPPTTPPPATEPPRTVPPRPPATSTTPSPTPAPSSTEPTPRVVPGRPLRLRRRPLTPNTGYAATAPRHPEHARLAAVPQAPALAALWLHAARLEHASVPAFAEVALLLAAVGAPLDLVAAAHRAALDEVAHTTLAYGLANAYGGTAHAPGDLPALLGRRVGPRRRRTALTKLAVEALRDGCLNEGTAGALAAAGAATAADPALRAALTTVAADEDAHAELSWQVLGWCLDTGGRPVRDAVAAALRRLQPLAPEPTPGLAAYGWPEPAAAAAVAARVHAATVARATGLLALTPLR
jgi:hypothetical protein